MRGQIDEKVCLRDIHHGQWIKKMMQNPEEYKAMSL